jgi:hypothetical protein
MTDPITMAIATTLASKAVELVSEPAKEAVAAITRKVREKFRDRPAAEAALAAAEADPQSSERIEDLAAALHHAALEDPNFGTDLRVLWSQVRVDANAQQDGVVNTFHGQADKVIQMRDVHGGLTIN